MTPYRDIVLESSGLFEVCARHTSRATARQLQSTYLCDPCARRLMRKAFNGRHPVFHGRPFDGYCALCNYTRRVAQRQWFVCPICWNIVLSYQKSMAASRYIRAWWQKKVAKHFSAFKLEETEAVYLSPYAKRLQTKLQTAAALEVLDFSVSVRHRGRLQPLFHIEQKVGPAAVPDMKAFQLDVNDYNDIAGAMNRTGLPAYVFHVHAYREYAFPTSRTKIGGLWWTDFFTLRRHLKRVAARRGEEDKKAAYFGPAAFQTIATFPQQLSTRGYSKLARKLELKRIRLIT